MSSPVVSHEITLDAAAAKWYLEYGQYLSNPTEYLSKIKMLLCKHYIHLTGME